MIKRAVRNKYRILLITVISSGCFFVSVHVLAGGLSKSEKGIFSLEYTGLMISSVENDMNSFLNWEPSDKLSWREPAQEAIKDLDIIEPGLGQLKLSGGLNSLKDELSSIIEYLKIVYDGIWAKSDEEIRKELGAFHSEVEKYKHNLTVYIDENLILHELPGDFDMDKAEEDFIRPADKDIFEQILQLMRTEKYTQAYDKLKGLLVKYKGSIFQGSIVSRIVDCCQMGNSRMKDSFDTGSSIKLLNDFIMSGNYSPKLYRIFEQWRTLKQSFYNGTSNWSVIPNKEYIKKRQLVAQNIERYLENNPDDIWAKHQIVMLMNLPVIHRGGSFGNTNIQHWATLFGSYKSAEGRRCRMNGEGQ